MKVSQFHILRTNKQKSRCRLVCSGQALPNLLSYKGAEWWESRARLGWNGTEHRVGRGGGRTGSTMEEETVMGQLL